MESFNRYMAGGKLEGGGEGGVVEMLLKNIFEEVHTLVKLPTISLQAYKFTKNELLHTHFSRILTRF